jgi:hypothetical protein
MNVTRGRAVFLKSIDCTDHMAEGGRKDAAYIASQTISTIEEFGPKNVVQVIMDGANQASWALIIATYWWIICSWCAAHVIDLFLEDIGKMGALGICSKILKIDIKIAFAAR